MNNTQEKDKSNNNNDDDDDILNSEWGADQVEKEWEAFEAVQVASSSAAIKGVVQSLCENEVSSRERDSGGDENTEMEIDVW
jgi:hypothetical protein